MQVAQLRTRHCVMKKPKEPLENKHTTLTLSLTNSKIYLALCQDKFAILVHFVYF